MGKAGLLCGCWRGKHGLTQLSTRAGHKRQAVPQAIVQDRTHTVVSPVHVSHMMGTLRATSRKNRPVRRAVIAGAGWLSGERSIWV